MRAGILALLFTLLGFASPAFAERVALVIGNGAYQGATTLANPVNDTRIVSDSLRRAGFTTVDVKTNLGKQAFDRALRDFAARADGAEVALVYFAGHGIEVGGVNWLMPTDVRAATDRDLEYEAVRLDTVLRAVENAKRMRIVILDACRDNPFSRSMRRVGGAASRSLVSRGLAAVEVNETLVVYAAKEGTTASDGSGSNNSPFAASLAKRLPEPGAEISILFRRVRDDVIAATNGAQEPFQYGSISGQEFYFIPPQGGVQPTPVVNNTMPIPQVDPEEQAWNTARQIDTPGAYDAFVRQYPRGRFAPFAREAKSAKEKEIAEARRQQQAAERANRPSGGGFSLGGVTLPTPTVRLPGSGGVTIPIPGTSGVRTTIPSVGGGGSGAAIGKTPGAAMGTATTITEAGITLSANSMYNCGEIRVGVVNNAWKAGDYLTIVEADAALNRSGAYKYYQGETPLQMNATCVPGQYEFRYMNKADQTLVRLPVQIRVPQ
jgi:uncharacterized caspase-like protein